ncbi:MAG: NAD(P)H-hydrate dehydratase [Planctomycetota bacterium]|jgi:NAD(P)H-hydrate epimerase
MDQNAEQSPAAGGGRKADLQSVRELPKLPPRSTDAHKGQFGRVLVVGGSRGMIGAAALAANGALRGGAGLVTFAAPATVQLTIAGLCPCATSVPLPCDGQGSLLPEAVRTVARAAGNADVLAVGPGMAVGAVQRDILSWALDCDKPLVIDADGLNNLASLAGWQAAAKGPLALTPHPGEFARLTNKHVEDIQADRIGAAAGAVRSWAAQPRDPKAATVCVLKGAGTVVTDGRRVYVNDTGNAGMATGGTGDVLTGMIAALIGQGLDPFGAACLGVWAHGRAGDLAAEKLGEASMMAWDLLDFLPAAMKERC